MLDTFLYLYANRKSLSFQSVILSQGAFWRGRPGLAVECSVWSIARSEVILLDFLSPVFLLSSPACPCTGNMQVPPFLCYARCWELWVRTHRYRLKRDGNCRLLYYRLVTAEDLECCLYFQTIVFSASGDQKCFMQTWI